MVLEGSVWQLTVGLPQTGNAASRDDGSAERLKMLAPKLLIIGAERLRDARVEAADSQLRKAEDARVEAAGNPRREAADARVEKAKLEEPKVGRS